MALNKFYGIEELLDPGIYTQRIKVKVSRKWKDSPPQTQSLGGISVFLTDNSNTRIYCWIPSNLAEFYGESLEEDECYEITNFMISRYVSNCRWSDDDNFLIFMNTTIVLPLQREDYFTVRETFKFTKLSMLDVQHFQENHCIDIIGILGKKASLDIFINKHGEEEVYLDFEIMDNINKKTVRFRNGMAQLCNSAFNRCTENDLEPTTISISCCRMQYNQYTNKILLIDSPATKFFINYRSAQHNQLCKRYRALTNNVD